MKRILMALVLCVSVFAGLAFVAAAQPAESDTSFTSGLSGDVIELGNSGDITFLPDDYDLATGRLVSEEYIWFTYGWSNFELVLVGGDNDTAEYFDLTTSNMVEFYETFEIVDEEITDDRAWFIANAEYQGTPLVVYYDFQRDALGDVDLVVMQFTDAQELAGDMEFVQSEVTVGGDPILPNADGQALQTLVTGDEPSTPDPATDESATVADRVRPRIGEPINSSETSDNPLDALLTQATAEATEPVVDEPTATPEAAGTTVAGGDWASMGLVSDTQWVSPAFDTAVVWDGATWIFPADYDYAIYINEQPLYESITLETTDGLGYVFITVEETGNTTPASLAEFWASPGYAMTFDAEITVVETKTTANTASVIYETVNSRDQSLYVVLTATFLDDGTVVYSQISAAPDTIHEVYGQYVEGVSLNGAPVDLTYSVDDITTISGN